MPLSPLTQEQQALVCQFLALAYKLGHQEARNRNARDWDATEEIVSEALESLVHAARAFDPGRGFRFSTYAVWTIRRRFQRPGTVNHRHIRYCQFPMLDEDGEYMCSDALVYDERQEEAERIAEKRESASKLDALLGRLDARTQAMVRQRYLDGLPLAEIGRRYQISKERVRQIIATGMREIGGR